MEEMIKSMQERISKLEESDKIHVVEILDLKMENLALKKEVVTIKQQQEAQKTAGKSPLGAEGKDQVKTLQEEVASLGEEIKKVKTKQNTITENLEMVERLKMCLNRKLVPAHQSGDSVEGIADLGLRMDALEQKLSSKPLQTPLVFDVRLLPSKAISTARQAVKLDMLAGQKTPSPLFDQKSCSLNPTVDGLCVVNIRMRHRGSGTVQLLLCNNYLPYNLYLGMTSGEFVTVNCTELLYLKKGQQFWLEAICTAGKCEIIWCKFRGWYLH